MKNYYKASEVQLEDKFQMPALSQGLNRGVQKQEQLDYFFPVSCLELNVMQSAILTKIIFLIFPLKYNGEVIQYKCIYYTNLFSIEFAACSNSSKLTQVLSMLNKRKPAEKSASAADAFLSHKTVKTEI